MSREAILQRIKKNKPKVVPLPEIYTHTFTESLDLVETFKNSVEGVGGKCFIIPTENLYHQVRKLFPDARVKYSLLKDNDLFNTLDMSLDTNQFMLAELDVLIAEGQLGVAENGAVWIANHNNDIRVLPFITKHLVLVVNSNNLVANMHEAYQNLSGKEYDFGVFISGPSKTADIEQSLVIGAQGALSLTVFVV